MNYKENLIDVLKHLKNVPPKEKEELREVVSFLEGKDSNITEDETGRTQMSDFLDSLLSRDRAMLNRANYNSILNFFRKNGYFRPNQKHRFSHSD